MAKLYTNIYVTFSSLLVIAIFIHPALATSTIMVTRHNVLTFGATPDGVTDSTEQFLSAWKAACNAGGPAVIIVPKGRYLLHPITFQGSDCDNANHTITFNVHGTLVAPTDFRAFSGAQTWLDFQSASRVSIVGGGTLDAKGSNLWDCKKSAGADCPVGEGATTLSFTNSENILIMGITSLNSQMFHVVINSCKNIHIEGVKIRASGSSPNTDGIHVQLSSQVKILKTNIKTGDDCISIGPGTKDLLIDHVACGPGHGISIGSLAKDSDEEGVENVRVKTIVLDHSTNGLRIKSWGRPSSAFVRGITYQDILMRNVANPIIIDQNYCPSKINCPDEESGVKVSDVKYEGIRGTSTTEIAVNFNCSATSPCTEITQQNVNLTYLDKPSDSFCSNAFGKAIGLVQPKSCL